MATTTKEVLNTTPTNIVPVTKAGDWVLPVKDVNGTTIYALQINKSAEDKKNIESILEDYKKAGVTVLTYNGKNNNPVLLVDATKKLKAQRVSASTEDMIAEMVALGVSEEVARKAIANAKAKKAKKQ